MLSSLFSKKQKMEWKPLSDRDQLNELDKSSLEQPILIFKHSTRCSISAMALSRFERNYQQASGFEPYFLDLIANRETSNAVADHYKVMHQSPQVILVKNGKVIYDASHNAISFDEVKEIANN